VKLHAEFTFNQVLEMGLMKEVDFIVEIGERAGKEYNIEVKLDGMHDKWEEIIFEFMDHKKTSIIKGYDEILIVLDEDIITTQSMLFSPFKKPFEERIYEWDRDLKIVSDVLEEWAKFQSQ